MIILLYALHGIFIGGLIYTYWRRQHAVCINIYFFPALLLKLLSGILVGFYYQFYVSGGDTFLFQEQSLQLTEYLKDSPAAYFRLFLTRTYESETIRTGMLFPWFSNSYRMVFLLSFLNFFTQNHYYLNTLYFSLFSFFGTWQLTKALSSVYPENRYAAVIAFLFFPSIVFWSSGIMKETIYVGALCWLISAVINLVYEKNTSSLKTGLSMLLAAYLLWKIRFYFAAVVYPLLLSFVVFTWLKNRYSFLKQVKYQVLVLGFCLLLFSFFASQLHGVFKLDYFFHQLTQNYNYLEEISRNKPHISYPELKPNVLSILSHVPEAVIQTTVRPFVWEGDNWFYRIAGLENTIILFLLMGTGVSLFLYPPKRFDVLAGVFIAYILIIGTLIGQSTPNLGTLNRYRVAFLPFLIYLLLHTNLFYKIFWQGINKPACRR